MAQSRLEKIGTIFSRVTGLLRSGAMRTEDKPIWYEVYKAFPPKLEPRYDRPAPNISIRPIFYEEDVIRAKFHKSGQQIEMINMSDTKHATQTQQFIKIYTELKDQGPLDEERIFDTARDMLNEQRARSRSENIQFESMTESEPLESTPPQKVQSLSESFVEAKNQREEGSKDATESKAAKSPSKAINIENLFKE